jgi:hypothetical protein
MGIKRFLGSREGILFLVIVALFLVLRVPGLSQPLHQDEYKWPIMVDPTSEFAGQKIPHPPLTALTMQLGADLVGFDRDMRLIPLTFGLANLFLLFYFLRRFSGPKVALTGALIFALAYFSTLASLMLDTDGQILPFYFLLSLIGYFHLKDAKTATQKLSWAILLALGLVGGLMVKLSFVLVIGAFAADFIWSERKRFTKKLMKELTIAIGATILVLGLAMVIAQQFFALFDFSFMFEYAKRFVHLDRNWLQSWIQAVKAVFYLSPLLILLPFFLKKEHGPIVRPGLFYILFGFIFYLVLFDFSVGALDRYLEFLIIPLVIIAAVILTPLLPSLVEGKARVAFWIGIVVALGITLLQFVPHVVPALHPKEEWIGRILSLDWNFLYPFSGGSGPLTFYVSFLVIGLTWVLSGLALLLAFVRREFFLVALAFVIPLSLFYTFSFTEEYLLGRINGSAQALVRDATAFIAGNDDIQKVVVYNDNGGDEIRRIGKYEKRLYTSPIFDVNQKIATMNAYSGHYLVIDAPPIDPKSVYAAYFATCTPIYEEQSKKMTATVYDCRNAPDIKN